MLEPEPLPCGLCGRPFPEKALTRHHLVPRDEGGWQVELLSDVLKAASGI